MSTKDDIKELETIIQNELSLKTKPDTDLTDKDDENTFEIVIYESPTPSVANLTPTLDEDTNADYNFARDELLHLITQGNEVLNSILRLIAMGPNPRLYEVAGQLMTTISQNTEKLAKIKDDYKKLTTTKEEQSPSTVNNTVVFNGTLEDLINLGKDKPKIVNND